MEESEKRRERLKAMRIEASQAGARHEEVGNSTESQNLTNPLVEACTTPPVQMNSDVAPRFDYYTDPLSAFSTDKRRSKVSNQNSQGYSTPRPRNTEMTSSAHHIQTNYSPDQRMFQVRGLHYSPGPRNPEMTPSPAYQLQTNYSPDQRMCHARSPYPNSSPNNPEMSPSQAHQIQSYCSPDQRVYQARAQYHNSGPYGSPLGMGSPFGTHQRTPGFWNGSKSPGASYFSSPHIGGSSSAYSNRGRGSSNSRYGGSPFHNSGRGRGHWSNNMRPGLGLGSRGPRDNVSAEIRPDLYYHRSMVEDPWKFLQPVIWKGEDTWVKGLNTPDSLKSARPKSVGLKKAKISEESGSQPSLAEYLAAAFNDAVNNEAGSSG
ncbi:hypothetical protein NMG60_11031323 [Bertholletia excelsa]